MTQQFGSLGAFAKHLVERNVAVAVSLQAATERIGKAVERTAKSEIGHYQPAIGPFPAWAELSEATKDERVRLGFTENEPLLRTGDLRDSITHHSEIMEAVIGTPAEKMVYLEFGTSKMPMRPVLGPAVLRNRAKIEAIAGAAVVTGLVGGSLIHPALGYDFTTP